MCRAGPAGKATLDPIIGVDALRLVVARLYATFSAAFSLSHHQTCSAGQEVRRLAFVSSSAAPITLMGS